MKKQILIFTFLTILLAGCMVKSENGQNPTTNGLQTEAYTANVFFNGDYYFPQYHKDGNEQNELEIFGAEQTAFLNALNQGQDEFVVNGVGYAILPLTEENYHIFRLEPTAEVILGKVSSYDSDSDVEALLQAGYDQAFLEDKAIIELERTSYFISDLSKPVTINKLGPSRMATQAYVEPYNPDNAEITATYQFRMAIEKAGLSNSNTFGFMGKDYSLIHVPGGLTILDSDGDLFAELSRYQVITNTGSPEPSLDFKNKAREAVVNGESSFSYTNTEGVETIFDVTPHANGVTWSLKPNQ